MVSMGKWSCCVCVFWYLVLFMIGCDVPLFLARLCLFIMYLVHFVLFLAWVVGMQLPGALGMMPIIRRNLAISLVQNLVKLFYLIFIPFLEIHCDRYKSEFIFAPPPSVFFLTCKPDF